MLIFGKINEVIKNFLVFMIIFSWPFAAPNTFANEKTPEQTIIEILDGLCVQNGDDFTNIGPMVEALGGNKLPEKFQKGDPALRRMGGESFVYPHKGKKFLVAYANGGGCTIGANIFEPEELKKKIVSNYHANLVSTQESGTQYNYFYEVGGTSWYKGAIISLMHGKKETNVSGGTISFIPSETVKNMLLPSRR